MTGEELKRFGPFSDLDDDERDWLVELFEERRLPDGKSAFREGSEAEGLVLLEEGRLELRKRSASTAMGVVEAPAALGTVSLFAFGRREITARAQGPCTIQVLPRTAMPRVVADSPRIAYRIAETVLGELTALIRPHLETLLDADTEDESG